MVHDINTHRSRLARCTACASAMLAILTIAGPSAADDPQDGQAAVIVADDFATGSGQASGKESAIGSTGWFSWTGPETKQIESGSEGTLVIAEADPDENYFDAAARRFDAVELEDGQTLSLQLKLKVRPGAGKVINSRDSLRVTLTDGEQGVALYLPTGDSASVQLGPTTDVLGSSRPPHLLRHSTTVDQWIPIDLKITRQGDAQQLTLNVGPESAETSIDQSAGHRFDLLAVTNSRGNFEVVLDDVQVQHHAD